uniref:hypothetical protein n=1 Tax=Haloplanus rallus TaxID=1816183 RepID=UPI003741FD78
MVIADGYVFAATSGGEVRAITAERESGFHRSSRPTESLSGENGIARQRRAERRRRRHWIHWWCFRFATDRFRTTAGSSRSSLPLRRGAGLLIVGSLGSLGCNQLGPRSFESWQWLVTRRRTVAG